MPGGRRVFSLVLGRQVPYTGSIGALVTALEPGHCRVEMRDRPAVRNHLQSIHAIAIANLGEVATGLAMLVALPSTVRGIVLGLEVEYLKKARGRLVAECRVVVPEIVAERTELPVTADIRDQAGDIVARVRARWLLGPVSGGRRAGE
jgi:acyl-coenzyme A thioesterase PaaI-like protein